MDSVSFLSSCSVLVTTGIETGNRRADSERGTDQAVGTGAHAAGGDGSSAGAGAYRAAQAAYASAGSVLHDAGIDAEDVGA